jgi:hypothetical protein
MQLTEYLGPGSRQSSKTARLLDSPMAPDRHALRPKIYSLSPVVLLSVWVQSHIVHILGSP